jgi:hypothetical protein
LIVDGNPIVRSEESQNHIGGVRTVDN